MFRTIICICSSNGGGGSSSSTQRADLWTVATFKKKHHKYIENHYTFEQPMLQKTHQKEEPLNTLNWTKPWEQTTKGTYKNTKDMGKANQINW